VVTVSSIYLSSLSIGTIGNVLLRIYIYIGVVVQEVVNVLHFIVK
jgi:hypothetical protein